VGAAPDTRYLGLYAQVAAVAAAMVLVGGRYLRVRRTAFIQSARDGVPPGQED
jgi:hypothetical protein